MIPSFDVFVINARPGVARRLGVDYETLRGLRPDLIYLENSGFGASGPSAARAGTDVLAQAYSGLMAGFGKTDEFGAPQPMRATAPVDYLTGLVGAMSVCAALFHRARSGEGQYVSSSLLATALAMQGSVVGELAVVDAVVRDPMLERVAAVRQAGGAYEEILAAREGTSSQLGAALFLYYGGYQTSDGAIVLGAVTDANRAQIRGVLGIDDDPTADPEFNALDPANDPVVVAMRERIRQLFLLRTTDEWILELDAVGAPASVVNLPEEMARDPQVEAAGLMVDLEHSLTGAERMVGPIVQMTATPTRAETASPALDADTDGVLREHGFTQSEIDDLRRSGVTGAAG